MPTKKDSGKHRAYLRIHPQTAENLGLMDGDRIDVESRRGVVHNLKLILTSDIDPRVVWSSDGWWQDDGNINLLTDDRHTAFGHTPGFNSVLVRVKKALS
jgi:anaerobic selenocysteine-containing dehydrogenase